MSVLQTLFALIRYEICGVKISDGIIDGITEKEIAALYSLSKKYDVSSILLSALSKLGKKGDGEVWKKFNKELAQTVFRYERLNYDLETIKSVLDEEGIDYIPLKGAEIRKYYPEPWMRTSCDIDVLIKESDLDKATKALCEKADYKTDGARDFHDLSLFSPSGMHLELHFNIFENITKIDAVLGKVWDYAVKVEEGKSCYQMTNEYIVFHNLAHMVYHVLCGGCGIRPFIDLYLLKENLEIDEKILSKLCSSCGIEQFRKEAEKLLDVWLYGKEHDQMSKRLEQYILGGGLYGNQEVGVAVNKKKKGKVGYFLNRIFQPYYMMKEKYPTLKKHKWLLPFYWVKRWFSIIFKGKGASSIKELNAGKTLSKAQVEDVSAFLEKLGLGDM